LYVAPDLVEEGVLGRRIRVRELVRELQLDGDRDQVLLDVVVEPALDLAPLGVRGREYAPARCAETIGERGVAVLHDA
jgi:hypothetical protein